jgi:hypothetical protein
VVPDDFVDFAAVAIEALAVVLLGVPDLAGQELVVVGAEVETIAVVAEGVEFLGDAGPGGEDAAAVGAEGNYVAELAARGVAFEEDGCEAWGW